VEEQAAEGHSALKESLHQKGKRDHLSRSGGQGRESARATGSKTPLTGTGEKEGYNTASGESSR